MHRGVPDLTDFSECISPIFLMFRYSASAPPPPRHLLYAESASLQLPLLEPEHRNLSVQRLVTAQVLVIRQQHGGFSGISVSISPESEDLGSAVRVHVPFARETAPNAGINWQTAKAIASVPLQTQAVAWWCVGRSPW